MKTILSALISAIVLLLSPPVIAATSNTQTPPRPSIGLALGSGGAGGLAHIAMLQVFDDLGIKPERIAGTSIGAVIGALYAAGLSAEEIRGIFDEFGGSSLDALSHLIGPSAELTLGDLLKIDIDNGGLFDSSGFIRFLAGKIEARRFEDLVIPLEIVATDYWTGEMVVLDRGDLLAAVQASMAVPGLFSPVARGEQLLIDGGTSNPLPFDLLKDRHELVVAIDVSGSRAQHTGNQVDLTDLLFNTFKIMQQSLIAARMRAAEPDIYIKPEISNIRLLHFNRIKTVLEQAQPAAEQLQRRLSQALAAERKPGSPEE
ncbi:MAG TPA: patatin-like phospholipase family protein [Desulfurivibrio alkaliphilus]|uniref:Patatin-like phospholipase family protein n=1 Tax=Desulfurivibrio alkaliphilus TaxID=427923 RepID=A0A7C2TM26_9BACT|nr:patatin-like phospholipase family protein [Desulfurivibrio alkaliphilus]